MLQCESFKTDPLSRLIDHWKAHNISLVPDYEASIICEDLSAFNIVLIVANSMQNNNMVFIQAYNKYESFNRISNSW